jgi:hypothetical protein
VRDNRSSQAWAPSFDLDQLHNRRMFGYARIVKPDRVPSADFISGKLPRFALQKRAMAQRINNSSGLHAD